MDARGNKLPSPSSSSRLTGRVGSAARSALPLHLPGAQGSLMEWHNNGSMISAASAVDGPVGLGMDNATNAGQSSSRDILKFPPGAVQRPATNDVLLGRGKPFQLWKGNQKMLNLIDELRPKYNEVARNGKSQYIEEVLRRVKSDGGRFMERYVTSDNSHYWVEVSRSKAYYKVGHAFRSTSARNRAARKVKGIHGSEDRASSKDDADEDGDDNDVDGVDVFPGDGPAAASAIRKGGNKDADSNGEIESGQHSNDVVARKPKARNFASMSPSARAAASASPSESSLLNQHHQSLLAAQEEILRLRRINALLSSGAAAAAAAPPSTSFGSMPIDRATMLNELRLQADVMRRAQSNDLLLRSQMLPSGLPSGFTTGTDLRQALSLPDGIQPAYNNMLGLPSAQSVANPMLNMFSRNIPAPLSASEQLARLGQLAQQQQQQQQHRQQFSPSFGMAQMQAEMLMRSSLYDPRLSFPSNNSLPGNNASVLDQLVRRSQAASSARPSSRSSKKGEIAEDILKGAGGTAPKKPG